jgi:hypothetical protein
MIQSSSQSTWSTVSIYIVFVTNSIPPVISEYAEKEFVEGLLLVVVFAFLGHSRRVLVITLTSFFDLTFGASCFGDFVWWWVDRRIEPVPAGLADYLIKSCVSPFS